MNYNILKYLFVIIAMVIGGYVTSLDIENILYVWGVSFLLLAVLIGKINYRNKNYLGMFFTSFKAMSYKLTSAEKEIGAGILLLMVSPFIFMLLMAIYGNLSL